MKELPKELTVELLSLVLEEKVIHIDGIKENCLWFYCDNVPNINAINTDTLTRLMKEWCIEQGYQVDSGLYMFHGNEIFSRANISYGYNRGKTIEQSTKTEFEAVLKATHWVATEKGLPDKEKQNERSN